MGSSDESVRLQTDVSAEVYEELCEKAPVPADASQAELLRYVIQRFLEDRHLDEVRASGPHFQKSRECSE